MHARFDALEGDAVTTNPHEAAASHLPSFITAPGQTDMLLVITAVFLFIAVVAIGILFWKLHTLPERMAHKTQKLQFEFVAVLGLISLFTHEHIYWIIGLLLAFIELPDFGTPMNRMANALEDIAKDETEAPVDASGDQEKVAPASDSKAAEVYPRKQQAEGSVHA